MATEAPQQVYNQTSQTLQWERLEQKRLGQLGLKVSPRSMNVLRKSIKDIDAPERSAEPHRMQRSGKAAGPQSASSPSKVNSVAPFSSLGKPTCGYFFNYTTDNRKRNFGIPPSDLVKYRNFTAN